MSEVPILVVDDDPDSLEVVRTYLEAQGYQVTTAANGQEALARLEEVHPAVMLLDVMMPGMDGWEVARVVKNHPDFAGVRVVMLTARSDFSDKQEGLRAGADDYITKPFSPYELLARVEASLRRRVLPDQVEVRPSYHSEGLTVDFKDRRVMLHGAPVALSATEYKLLFQLAANPGRVLTNQELLQRVWGPEYSGEFHLLRSFIRNLRKKLGDDARSPRLIFTERGIGYRMREG
jgi:DNA-binding response OmpR family regulator